MGNKAEPALSALIEALNDEDRIVRVAAVYAVVNFGHKAIAAISILETWLDCGDEFSQVAAAAIIRIDPATGDGQDFDKLGHPGIGHGASSSFGVSGAGAKIASAFSACEASASVYFIPVYFPLLRGSRYICFVSFLVYFLPFRLVIGDETKFSDCGVCAGVRSGLRALRGGWQCR